LLLSGAGMFTIEATAVSAEGRNTPGDLGIYDDGCEAAIAAALARVRREVPAPPVAMQLAHAGRKGSSRAPWDGGQIIPLDDGGWVALAPSSMPHADGERAPQALDAPGLARIRDAFVSAAERAQRCGIDALQLHFAHGYLLHEFLSPLANRRADRYGGSFENRIRFPLEVFDAVRRAWPEAKPLGVRLSCTDWVDGGWTLDESVALARELVARGCDFIDCSSGGVSPGQRIPLAPGYQVPLAREIRRATGAVTTAVGLISEPQHAEALVAQGDADLVAMARAMLWNPRWGWHAARALGATVRGPKQYWRSLPRDAAGVFGDIRIGQR
jgi:2,4-dienoyl-CoA reductase-like NADH-dependent reductase (Old Yellow Enzyme family)